MRRRWSGPISLKWVGLGWSFISSSLFCHSASTPHPYIVLSPFFSLTDWLSLSLFLTLLCASHSLFHLSLQSSAFQLSTLFHYLLMVSHLCVCERKKERGIFTGSYFKSLLLLYFTHCKSWCWFDWFMFSYFLLFTFFNVFYLFITVEYMSTKLWNLHFSILINYLKCRGEVLKEVPVGMHRKIFVMA